MAIHKIQKNGNKVWFDSVSVMVSYLIVRNRLPPLSIAPCMARFIGYIVRNKEIFL